MRISTSIKKQIIDVNRTFYKTKELLVEPWELNDYLVHMDTIGLFFIGCKKYFNCKKPINDLEKIESLMKNFIERQVIPSLINEYGADILTEFIIDFDLDFFWWRQVWKNVDTKGDW
jgi:hypothetical protein